MIGFREKRTRQMATGRFHRLDRSSLWWLQPHALLCVVVIPIYVASSVYMMGPVRLGSARQFYGAIDLNAYLFTLGLIWLITVALFSLLGALGGSERPTAGTVNPAVLRYMLFAVAIGYVFFFIGALRGGVSQVAGIFAGDTGAASSIKRTGQLFPGVSTMTQFGPAYAVGYFFLSDDQRRRPLYRFGFFLVIVLSIARAIIWSERLAILEVCIPSAIASAVRSGGGKGLISNILLGLAPFLGLALLVAMFTAFESVRSWQHYAPLYGGDLIAFGRDRLVLYYATALNNGASIITNIPHSVGQIFFSLDWLFRFPLMNLILPVDQYNAVSNAFVDLQQNYLDKEFTNTSAVFVYIWDYGPILSIVVAALFGFFLGRTYRSARIGALVGKMLLPFLILGLLEILRTPILTAGRFFYVWMGVSALIFIRNPGIRARRVRISSIKAMQRSPNSAQRDS